MKILVCGGRDYCNRNHIFATLNSVRAYYGKVCIIEGGARGADRLAREWAEQHGVPFVEMPANWAVYDKVAGGIRNGWMLEWLHPDFVLAFPGGSGTANMKRQATNANIPVFDV